jgi:hypothetical protein
MKEHMPLEPAQSPWEPLRRLSRWPLILMQVFLGICALGLLALACAVAAEYDGGWKASLIILLFASLAAFGLRKAYRLERALAKLQDAPADEELGSAIAGIWNNPGQRDLPPQEAWLAARPRLRLFAIAGLLIFFCASIPNLLDGIDEYRKHPYGQPWKRSFALGCFALYGAWVFLELYRCAAKLTPDDGRLGEAMEHYRRFHNYGAIFAVGIVWAMFCSFLM